MSNLTLTSGQRVCESNRKTGVVGFMCGLICFCHLFDTLVGNDKPLKYLLGYKFSQDHLELFFCAVRGRGGWNNNPTARQFKAAFKRLLIYHEVKAAASGNCIPQQATDLLTISSRIDQQQNAAAAEQSVEYLRGVDVDAMNVPWSSDHDYDYCDIPNYEQLSLFVENVVVYIAGFVV